MITAEEVERRRRSQKAPHLWSEFEEAMADLIAEQAAEIERLKAEQPKAEPVAYLCIDGDYRCLGCDDDTVLNSLPHWTPLYIAPPVPTVQPKAATTCRTDGRCQYAIDHGAEGMGWCPKGECCMPATAVPEGWKLESKRLIPLLQSFADRLANNSRHLVHHPELYEGDHDTLMESIRHLKQIAAAPQGYSLIANETLAQMYKQISGNPHHASDCSTSNAPATTPGPCDCAAAPEPPK